MRGWDANPDDPTQQEYKDEPIEVGGPDWREGSLPYTEMVLAMLDGGIPAYRGKKTGYVKIKGKSYPTATPGWYLCNFLTYKLAKYVEEEAPDLLAGFIHIPTRPEYVAWDRADALDKLDPESDKFTNLIEGSPSASMEMDRMIEGIRVSLEECVRAKAGK
jgi:pyrrolidone-carboxylate peptidase